MIFIFMEARFTGCARRSKASRPSPTRCWKRRSAGRPPFAGQRLTVKEPGFLILKYSDANLSPKETQNAALSGPGGGIAPPCPDCKGITKIVSNDKGDEILRQFLKVYTENGLGEWELIHTVYPRFVDLRELIELQDYFQGTGLTIKLEWTVSIDLDDLPYLKFTEEELPMTETPMLYALHS